MNGKVRVMFKVPSFTITHINEFIQYFIPWARVGEAASYTKNEEVNQKLWDWLDAQVEQFENSRVSPDAPVV